MAKAYYSVALDHSAADVWSVIRPFDHYAWAGVESETIIEAGKSGDQVGAIRRVIAGEKVIRQVLLAHSDLERSYSYAMCDPAPFPVRNYLGTIHVAPIIEGGKAFVEWRATFDCPAEEHDRWINHFEREGFARWLAALRRFMAAAKRRTHGISEG
ncbi:MAG: SRPBCC family protein [Acetobacteraceae bacterium]